MITTNQIRNVLRVYGSQLKKRNTSLKEEGDAAQHPTTFVDISIEARKKQMLSQVSNDLISQITPKSNEHHNADQNIVGDLISESEKNSDLNAEY